MVVGTTLLYFVRELGFDSLRTDFLNRHTWRLPDGIDEVLPPDAWALEQLRRRVLDLFVAWGYSTSSRR